MDEGVTRLEGEGRGEPVAKRLKSAEDRAAGGFSGYARSVGQNAKLKQVPAPSLSLRL